MAWPAAPLAFTRVELQTRSPAAKRACDATPPASCNSAKHRSYAGRQMRAGLFAAKLVLEAASPYSARNMTLHRICAARSALSGALVGVVLAGCSTGRVPARESEAPHAHRPAAGSPPVATPDFDASAMRVRALLEQLVAADTENQETRPGPRRSALPACRPQGSRTSDSSSLPAGRTSSPASRATGLQDLCCCSPTPTSCPPLANPGRVRRTD